MPIWIIHCPAGISNDLDLIRPESPPCTSEEIEKVIMNLPNNKASSTDGVTYETLKTTRQTSSHILKRIFNTCLLNGKIPGKGTLKRNLWSSVYGHTETRRALSDVANPLRAPLRGLTCTSQFFLLFYSVNPSIHQYQCFSTPTTIGEP